MISWCAIAGRRAGGEARQCESQTDSVNPYLLILDDPPDHRPLASGAGSDHVSVAEGSETEQVQHAPDSQRGHHRIGDRADSAALRDRLQAVLTRGSVLRGWRRAYGDIPATFLESGLRMQHSYVLGRCRSESADADSIELPCPSGGAIAAGRRCCSTFR